MPNETETNVATPVAPEVAPVAAEVTPPTPEPETSDTPEETTPHVEDGTDGGAPLDHQVQATV